MRKILVCMLAWVCLEMVGCARKELTREQFLSLNQETSHAMKKVYLNTDKEKIILACEKALKASDNKYEITQHNADGFYAKRRWLLYMILAAAAGENHWKITAREKSEGIEVEAKSWQGDGLAAGPFPVPVTGKSENEYYISPTLYNLFWGRVDYFLGISSIWPKCSEAEKNMHLFELGNELEALCNVVRSTDPTQPKEEM